MTVVLLRARATPEAENRSHRTAKATNQVPSGFRLDVEGLRAVAVGTVLAFHAGIPHLAGGFVGVDVFFVISGFLITGLMLKEHEGTGRIDLPAFYARRARRILPSAATVLVVTAIVSWFILPLLRVHDMAKDLLSAATYVANWHYISQGTNYLAPSTDNSPFLHYWSLAVEEQFYLVWPALVIFAMWAARRTRRSSGFVVGAVVMAASVGSYALSLHQTHAQPGTAYLGTGARVWQFGVGALLAVSSKFLLQHRRSQGLRVSGFALGWLGLGALVLATVTFGHGTPYPGNAALLPTLGAAAIIASGTLWHASPGSVGGLLALPPLRAIGRLSFAWYLWHWPVLVLAQADHPSLTWQQKSLLVLAAAVPAQLTVWLVERPIRYSRVISLRTSSGLAVGALATVLALVAGLAAGSRALLDVGDVGAFASAPTLTSVFGSGDLATSGAVRPSPLKARADRPMPDECLLQAKETVSPVDACRFGKAGGSTVVLFGDSHAQQWLPAVRDLGEKYGWSIVVLTKSGCPVPNISPRKDGSLYSMPECAQWRSSTIDLITRQLNPALIIVSSLGNYIPSQGEILTAWNTSLDRLRTTGAPIVEIGDTPFPNKDVPACMSSALNDWTKCSFSRSKALTRDPVALEALAGREQHVNVVNFTNYLCPQETCPAARSNILFYRDDSHITQTLAHVLTPALEQSMVADKVLSPAGAILVGQ